MKTTVTGCGALLAMVLASCGGDGKDGKDEEDGDTISSVGDPELAQALDALGVDTSQTARLSPEGDPLPEAYAPFGARVELGRIDELFLVGVAPAGETSRVTFLEGEGGAPRIIGGQGVAQPVWAEQIDSFHGFPQVTRAAGAAELDGDGREEAFVVYVDRDDPDVDTEITLDWFDDADAASPFASQQQVLTLLPGVVDIAVASGDLDGDAHDGLVLGLTTANLSTVVFVENDGGTLAEAASVQLQPQGNPDAFGLRVATGNLDRDLGAETVVVLNQVTGETGGAARYVVYDDASAGYAELTSGVLTVLDEGTYTAVVMDAVIADVDGDELGEVMLGGLGGYLGNNCGENHVLGEVLDDAIGAFVSLGIHHEAHRMDDCGDPDIFQLRFIYANALDLDGDGLHEMALNHWLFDDLKNEAPFVPIGNVSESEIVRRGDRALLDRNTLQITAGDVNADLRQDLVIWSQERQAIRAFGLGPTGRLEPVVTFDLTMAHGDRPLNAQLVTLNLDSDTAVLAHTDGASQLVFTEPVVLAVLAAAPCYADLDQWSPGCGTSFGTETSSTVTTEQVVSVTASASIGVNVDGGAISQSEFEFKATLSSVASAIANASYSLSEAVAYTNGSSDDAVLFTTIPYDQYRYTVLSHPDPELVGQEVVVGLPRAPITLFAERSFYNASIPEGELRIDDAVFSHTAGDPWSYRTAPEKNQILADRGGLQTGPETVPQGESNNVALTLTVGDELGQGGALELGYEVALNVTAGTVLAGYSVGASAANSLVVTSGTATTYGGSLGSLPADVFADNLYSAGVFTYVYEDPTTGQQFEVVDYWVE